MARDRYKNLSEEEKDYRDRNKSLSKKKNKRKLSI